MWEHEPLNAEPPADLLAAHDRTPADLFYVRSHGPTPLLAAAAHRVVVDGLVERPLDLSLGELLAIGPVRTVTATLQCAGNRRRELLAVRAIDGEIPWGPTVIGTATWSGVALADVLAAAGPRGAAAHVELLGAERDAEGVHFGGSVPLEKAVSPEVLLAHTMNGAPLAPEHGAPLRAVVPGYIGARSVKWLTRIRVLDAPSANHYHASAYRLYPPYVDDPASCPDAGTVLGELPVNAAILGPEDGAVLPAGAIEVCGYAITGGSATVARVDVTADGGATWTSAELLGEENRWAWRRWRAVLVPAAGRGASSARGRSTPPPTASRRTRPSCGTSRGTPTTRGPACASR